jgi:hypothetical protein
MVSPVTAAAECCGRYVFLAISILQVSYDIQDVARTAFPKRSALFTFDRSLVSPYKEARQRLFTLWSKE